MTPDTSVATFFTTHAALRAEGLLKQAGIPGRLIPAPRDLSPDCTVALAFPAWQKDRVQAILSDGGIEASGIHVVGKEM
jgi:hypothetical protein